MTKFKFNVLLALLVLAVVSGCSVDDGDSQDDAPLMSPDDSAYPYYGSWTLTDGSGQYGSVFAPDEPCDAVISLHDYPSIPDVFIQLDGQALMKLLLPVMTLRSNRMDSQLVLSCYRKQIGYSEDGNLSVFQLNSSGSDCFGQMYGTTDEGKFTVRVYFDLSTSSLLGPAVSSLQVNTYLHKATATLVIDRVTINDGEVEPYADLHGYLLRIEGI